MQVSTSGFRWRPSSQATDVEFQARRASQVRAPPAASEEAVVALGFIFSVVGFVRFEEPVAHFTSNILFAVGIIVANVPEGLPTTVTVSLTLTTKSLATKKVCVYKRTIAGCRDTRPVPFHLLG